MLVQKIKWAKFKKNRSRSDFWEQRNSRFNLVFIYHQAILSPLFCPSSWTWSRLCLSLTILCRRNNFSRTSLRNAQDLPETSPWVLKTPETIVGRILRWISGQTSYDFFGRNMKEFLETTQKKCTRNTKKNSRSYFRKNSMGNIRRNFWRNAGAASTLERTSEKKI